MLRNELLAIYGALAEDIAAAAPVCEISGRCCRFEEYGHTLFLSRPEAELLLEEGLPPEAEVVDGLCPFQVGKLCSARERRPLGCRVYFCDPKYAGMAEPLTEKHVAELKRAHELSQTPWEYRPLHHYLREFVDSADCAEETGRAGR